VLLEKRRLLVFLVFVDPLVTRVHPVCFAGHDHNSLLHGKWYARGFLIGACTRSLFTVCVGAALLRKVPCLRRRETALALLLARLLLGGALLEELMVL